MLSIGVGIAGADHALNCALKLQPVKHGLSSTALTSYSDVATCAHNSKYFSTAGVRLFHFNDVPCVNFKYLHSKALHINNLKYIIPQKNSFVNNKNQYYRGFMPRQKYFIN